MIILTLLINKKDWYRIAYTKTFDVLVNEEVQLSKKRN